MQCPNCRKIEKGQWLYANGSRPLPEFSMDDWAHDEDIYDLSYSEMVILYIDLLFHYIISCHLIFLDFICRILEFMFLNSRIEAFPVILLFAPDPLHNSYVIFNAIPFE